MQQSAAAIRRLIAVAQKTPCAEVRAEAMKVLWDWCGAPLVGSMAKTSYELDSDFSYRGYSPAERQRNMMGNAFFVFYNCVMTFDEGMGVPFAAYAAQKGNWRVADEKRVNSKRAKYEVITDFSKLDAESKLVRRATVSKEDFEKEIMDKDMVRSIRKSLGQDARLGKYFDACQELCEDDLEYSDAEVARRMGCTRANVGLCRKALAKKVKDSGLFA